MIMIFLEKVDCSIPAWGVDLPPVIKVMWLVNYCRLCHCIVEEDLGRISLQSSKVLQPQMQQ